MRRAILAVLLTLGILIFEIVGEGSFGSGNRSWSAIENVLNFPGQFVLYVVGPGHGFSQLVLPMLFVFLSYPVLFWFTIPVVERLLKKLIS